MAIAAARHARDANKQAQRAGRDLEEGIACATAGLRRRFAARVWRDYYKHVDARRRYANPTDEGLIAQQRDRQIEEESRRRENEERVAQYNYFAARASNRSAWLVPRGAGAEGERTRSNPGGKGGSGRDSSQGPRGDKEGQGEGACGGKDHAPGFCFSWRAGSPCTFRRFFLLRDEIW